VAFAVIAVLSAIVAVTCATEGAYRMSSAAPAARASAPVAPVAPHTQTAPAAGGPDGGVEPALRLPRLYGALRELAAGQRKLPVRVLWLGDSHSAADYLPHGVRSALADRFGAGGPGHLLVGLAPYRHGWAEVQLTGTWEREPRVPARSRREDDGVFGLGGMRFRPKGGARAVLRAGSALRDPARFTILFRARDGARLTAKLGDQPARTLNDAAGTPGSGGSGIRRLVLEGSASSVLKFSNAVREPELFGVIVEGAPGVVVDTLGINGARVSTPLAWDEATFSAELRERAPVLAVLAYGTNEAFDTRNVQSYAEELVTLVTRLRRGAADLECLVLGPPDAATAGGGSLPRIVEIESAYRAAAERSRCAFFSLRDAMGGEGSFAAWARDKPPLARPDRVHLTPRGYERLGQALAKALLDSYAASTPPSR
jgi:lysophospholipase L1-like esterase